MRTIAVKTMRTFAHIIFYISSFFWTHDFYAKNNGFFVYSAVLFLNFHCSFYCGFCISLQTVFRPFLPANVQILKLNCCSFLMNATTLIFEAEFCARWHNDISWPLWILQHIEFFRLRKGVTLNYTENVELTNRAHSESLLWMVAQI